MQSQITGIAHSIRPAKDTSLDALCRSMVIRSMGEGPKLASCVDLVAARAVDAKQRVRVYWRKK